MFPLESPREAILYYTPISCPLVPYIALTEAGATFEVPVVNIKRREHNWGTHIGLV
jgi:hypothetical protein